ncbi:hypothetical protein OA85_04445 [Flavobacterium sp. AED]|nr:hypothetical protein OA85_04445 [Flavobacterium sp. AED]
MVKMALNLTFINRNKPNNHLHIYMKVSELYSISKNDFYTSSSLILFGAIFRYPLQMKFTELQLK